MIYQGNDGTIANLNHFKTIASMLADPFYIEKVILKLLEHDYCEIGDRQYNCFSCCLTLEFISFPKSMLLYPILFSALQTAAV